MKWSKLLELVGMACVVFGAPADTAVVVSFGSALSVAVTQANNDGASFDLNKFVFVKSGTTSIMDSSSTIEEDVVLDLGHMVTLDRSCDDKGIASFFVQHGKLVTTNAQLNAALKGITDPLHYGTLDGPVADLEEPVLSDVVLVQECEIEQQSSSSSTATPSSSSVSGATSSSTVSGSSSSVASMSSSSS